MFGNIVIVDDFYKIELLGDLSGKIKNNNEQKELDRIHCS